MKGVQLHASFKVVSAVRGRLNPAKSSSTIDINLNASANSSIGFDQSDYEDKHNSSPSGLPVAVSSLEIIEEVIEGVNFDLDERDFAPQPEPKNEKLSQEEILKLFSQVYGDKNRYKQILLNFLSNAVKFTKMGKNIHIYLTILDVHPKDARRMSLAQNSQQSGSKSRDVPSGLQEFSVRF